MFLLAQNSSYAGRRSLRSPALKYVHAFSSSRCLERDDEFVVDDIRRESEPHSRSPAAARPTIRLPGLISRPLPANDDID